MLRSHQPSRSRDWEVYKAEAPIDDDAHKMYDVAVLVTMPHSHTVDDWGGLGEYVIGTTKFISPAPLDNLIPS
jgi:hypothetical protein